MADISEQRIDFYCFGKKNKTKRATRYIHYKKNEFEIIKQTEKAVCIKFNFKKDSIWLAKSQINFSDNGLSVSEWII